MSLFRKGVPGLPDLGGLHALSKVGNSLINQAQSVSDDILPNLQKRDLFGQPAVVEEQLPECTTSYDWNTPGPDGEDPYPEFEKREIIPSVFNPSNKGILGGIAREYERLSSDVLPTILKRDTAGSSGSNLQGVNSAANNPVAGQQLAPGNGLYSENSPQGAFVGKRALGDRLISGVDTLLKPGMNVIHDVSDGLSKVFLPFLK
nr:uncharacterized protein LOC116425029 [Nomia melanderi]